MRRAMVLSAMAVLLAAGEGAAQTRAAAEVSCRPAAAKLQYDCTIKLIDRRSKAPLAGAAVSVGADMPSMPMAHNVRPAKAMPTAEPGAYQVRIALEMHGDWALRIDVAGPLRDRLIVPLRFDDKAVRPSPSRAAPHRGH
jgi:YtkA-like